MTFTVTAGLSPAATGTLSNTATVMRRDLSEDAASVVEQHYGAHLRIKPGRRIEVPITLLVPGYVIMLSAGDMIPADCRILRAQDLFMNQAAMTGESLPPLANRACGCGPHQLDDSCCKSGSNAAIARG